MMGSHFGLAAAYVSVSLQWLGRYAVAGRMSLALGGVAMMDGTVHEATVHVVDDDDAVRSATAALIGANGYRVQQWTSGETFLQRRATEEPGCAVLDLRMPGATGLDVIERLKGEGTRLSFVMMTGHADVGTAVAAMKLGATDFLEKPYDASALMEAVGRAIRISAAHNPVARSSAAARLLEKLTQREQQVLRALVGGGVNKTIGRDLGLSPRTVEMHRANLMDKLGARTLSDALRIAYEAGLGFAPTG
jgi:two-component system, LuxR family, response regulator FixJ